MLRILVLASLLAAAPAIASDIALPAACTVVGPATCFFVCDFGQPILLVGAGGAGASVTLACGTHTFSCAFGALPDACILDLTGIGQGQLLGTCSASAGAAARCGSFMPPF